ncbi:type II restriction endonuclease subunit R [Clostridium botulinum]|nr:restriction endonuclease subunit S [Clostridium botulinum]NFF19939.1 type II restriction endonuclease subunit R [Clostridium botulinum]NFM73994.1 type II restriction endonuclease subunit R [Clostridium botulinum]NFP79110.1 type II restriction endonuclease subunit R [Clostridium botulinum]NFP93831.1 type II restriction endonuclease subunit R [Clostridium botulinum]
MDAPLNEKLQKVEWGEYDIGDLFEKIKVKSLKYKTAELPSEAINEFVLPALTAGVQNQGLNNFVPKDNATILKNVISVSANGANTGATFYQNKEFTVLQDAYAIKWKYTNDLLTDNHYLYLTCSISKTIFGNYEWTNKAGWERIKSEKIQLPIKNGKIDFKFMETFIAELEAERMVELEAYLLVTGLKDYTLTAEEKQVLDDFENVKFEEFNVVDLFDVKNSRNILSKDIIENSGETPYLCASSENNAVSSYISYDKKYLDKGNCIFIGGKTFVVTYQEKDFYSNDSHNLILSLKNEEEKSKLNQLYLVTCINKSLGHKYSWGDSISNKKIQTDKVSLPAKNQQPYYAIMETFISAIQKLVIKDVVLYANKKLDATKYVVNKKA